MTVEFVARAMRRRSAVRLFVASELRAEAERFTATAPDVTDAAAIRRELLQPGAWRHVADESSKNDSLVLANEGSELVDISGALAPAMTDAFTAGGGVIHFTRDASGNVTGYDVSASRMRGIRFERAKPGL